MIRRIGYALSVVVLAGAAWLVPLPLVELAPGGATPVAPLVRLDTETTAIDGSLELLTIQLRSPSLVDAVGAWLSPTRELDQRERVIPSGVDENDYFRIQRQQFERSFRVAVAVGLRAAGEEVEFTTRPMILSVLRGGPADGVLQAGDLVLGANGTPVATAEELIAALSDLEPGDVVELVVDRGGDEPLDLSVTAGRIPELDRPAGIGIGLDTIANDVELPFDVALEEPTGIGGASGGLIFALTVYDLVSEEDLTAGRIVAATGTIGPHGEVGPIGGIREKVAAAEAAGADILLVPATQEATAQRVAADDLRVVGVRSFQDALRVLRENGAG